MKKIYITTFLLCSFSPTAPMYNTLIQLPSKHILKQRLCNNGFNHFVKISTIDQTLGSQKQDPLDVVKVVDSALYDYDEYLKDPRTAALMQNSKTQLIETILADHPQTIEQLKKDGKLNKQIL